MPPSLRVPAWYLLLTALVAAWGLASLLNTDDIARAGYSLSRGHLVVRVLPGSSADRAGLRTGDSIVRIDGVPTRDRAAVARLSRGAIGSVRRLDILRGEASLALDLTLAGLAPRERWLRHARIFTGFGFLVICGLAFLRAPAPATRALGVMGLGIGVAFMGDAGMSAGTLRTVAALARNALILVGIGAGLHYLRIATAPRRGLRMHPAVIYVPLGAFWLLLSVRTLFSEDTPVLVKSFTSITGGLLFGLYLTLAIVTVMRAWIRSRQTGVHGDAMRLLCLGTLLGLLPAALAAVLPVLAPSLDFPGMDFWFLAVLIVPLSWARASVTIED